MTGLPIAAVRSGVMQALAWTLLVAPWLMFSAVTVTSAAGQSACPDECDAALSEVIDNIGEDNINLCDTHPKSLGIQRGDLPIHFGSQIGEGQGVNLNGYDASVTITKSVDPGRPSAACYTIIDNKLVVVQELTQPQVWACIRDVNDYCSGLGF